MTSPDPKTPELPSTNPTPADQTSKQPQSSSIDPQIPQESPQETETPKNSGEPGGQEADGEEEEEGECGFCLYMKGGGCKEVFTEWENCIKEAEDKGENIVNKCYDVTSQLRVCMQANADYYEPILRAEKAAEEEALKELDKEKDKGKEEALKESEANAIEKNLEKAVDAEHTKSSDGLDGNLLVDIVR